ncbi:cupin domain-containing protein [Hymenobacter chitinivorans]|uniref:Mannose-6-phosphate isomerase-like protein (Cupin superfamily) n=1 Tax=Hymenobacter chitinivorans DSM 11115 TaxID=1121954 RepID=A0A2M9BR38_9BACT|nr:cupin domain-containing protein [Hymenobacter chitinivorans]PJJ60420.1 mannose-6-phosphate isomerase-like protein (cupin superfamily) [Hymenobacter chitinivorans DSM 11115]
MNQPPAFPVSTATAEHYRWGEGCDGWHLVKTAALSIIQERMPAGAREVSHYHERAYQFFFVLAGEATLEINGVPHRLQAQQGLAVPPLVVHQLRNESGQELHFTVTSQPPSHGDRILV